MSTPDTYPRFLYSSLIEALADTPVVLIHGPRQVGKTTLAQQAGKAAGYDYISFDDDVQREAARRDTMGFVAELSDKVILDEVQRVPELFTALKLIVDKNRRPGRFILTGSANVLLVPKLADSLAGRMEILQLYPLTQAELLGKQSHFLDHLFNTQFKMSHWPRLGRSLAELIVAGGYPAALARVSAARRATWYRNYMDMLLQRDVQELGRIHALDALPRLLTLLAGQTARLLNVAELAAPFHLSRPTIRDYVTLLERIFLLEELPAWYNNRLKRLIKTPKLHLVDTGLACALLGLTGEALWADRMLLGQLLETFVYQEVRRQAGWLDESIGLYHFRDKEGIEVDIVLERGNKIAGIEIKAAATVTAADFKGLQKLKDTAGNRFSSGIVLYDGETLTPFGEKLFAVPVRALWEL